MLRSVLLGSLCLWNLSPLIPHFSWLSLSELAVYPRGMLHCYGTRGLAAVACWCCLVRQLVSSDSQQTQRRQQWPYSWVILTGHFTLQAQSWQHFSCQLQPFDRCRNGVKGQIRCVCASGDMSDTGLPVCHGLFPQKMAWIQHDIKMQGVALQKRERASHTEFESIGRPAGHATFAFKNKLKQALILRESGLRTSSLVCIVGTVWH